MIEIISYLHRDELRDIIRRWMYNEAHPGDADRLAEIVLFNDEYVSRYLAGFAEELFARVHGSGLTSQRITRKGELKDLIVSNPPYRNERIDALIRQYHDHPGRYYRETPFVGTVFLKGEAGREFFVGSTRIKRIRRLAEKSARLITDQIFRNIKKQADALADERARQLGVPRLQLVTPPEEMVEEFLEAENRVIAKLAAHQPLENMSVLKINDVAGLKIIVEDDGHEQLLESLRSLDNCEVIEQERHEGSYNATNLIVSFRPSREGILGMGSLAGHRLQLMRRRGITEERMQVAFRDFVLDGEPDVCLEIIVINYQENLESEIGRCIHEDRILEQRRGKQYRGHLAKNIEYLMEYLFTFPSSGRVELGELPIKLWNRYLPDYFDEVMKQLFDIRNRVDDPIPPFDFRGRIFLAEGGKSSKKTG